MNTAPLLKEERYLFVTTDAKDVFNPLLFHWSGAAAALSSDDSPMDT